MNQNISDCDCKDYSLLTANTGISQIRVGNTNLDGSGTLVTAITATASANGTTIKAIRIKAIEPIVKGMIRLFITSGGTSVLYKELPIPTTPQTQNTPTPYLVLPMYEYKIEGELKLQAGDSLSVSSQNTALINVIVDGLDWVYPTLVQTSPLPPLQTCCNFKQEYAVSGVGIVGNPNTNLDGTGSITPIYTAGSGIAGANGSVIKSMTIKALQSTNPGMIRFFINDGTTKSLFKEVMIPETTQSGFEPSFKTTINENLYLKTGYSIGVATQIAQNFAIVIEGNDWIYPIA